MDKRLIIIGIDPGTTLGYAVLDIDGKLIETGSSKDFNLSRLIERMMELGKPFIVGHDKKRAPGFVETFAAKTGSIIMGPKEDLLVKEKKDLTKSISFNNDHEMDALAGAIYAYKKTEKTLKKIERFLKEQNKKKYRQRLTELTLKNNLNMKFALEILERPQEDEKIIIKVIEKKELNEKDFIGLYEKMKKTKQANMLLKRYNAKLKKSLDDNEKKNAYLRKKIDRLVPEHSVEEKIKFKEDKLRSLYSTLTKKENQIDALRSKIIEFDILFRQMDDLIVLKKLRNLGWKEYSAKKHRLEIKESDVLFVDNPEEFSTKTIDELKGKISVVLSGKKITKKMKRDMPFVLIDIEGAEIIHKKHFAFIKKDELDRLKKGKMKINEVHDILEEYKKDRKSSIE